MITRHFINLAFGLFCFCSVAHAQVTYTVLSSADAFLATGVPGGTDLTGFNYGGAGTLMVSQGSPTSSEFQSVMRFDVSGATNLFNTSYGTNNWVVIGISLQLTSNNGLAGEQPDNALFPTIQGGQFVITWLSNDDWIEGTGAPNRSGTNGVMYNSLPNLFSGVHDIVNTNTYTPPGDNLPATYTLPLNTNLVNDVAQGNLVSFLFYAADNQISYLFNSYNFMRGNEPLIHITAAPAQFALASGSFTNGSFRLTGLGAALQPYQIQTSTNLAATNWQTIGTTTANGSGALQFDDATASDHWQRFYRLKH